MQTFELKTAPAPVKLLASLIVVGIGISYIFGLLMVVLWVGLTPGKVVQTYSQPKPAQVTQQESRVTETPIDLDTEIMTPHTIDRELLIQDTHVHLPVYTLIAAVLSVIAIGLDMRSGNKMWLICALFVGGWLDFLGMWGVKYIHAWFAFVTLAGGWMMFASWLVVTALATKQMWFDRNGG